MRRLAGFVVLVGGAVASADPMVIDGNVVASQSRWTSDHSRIITESTIQTASGSVVVSQLGGSVDGLGMITMPAPPILQVGAHATVRAHVASDLQGASHVVIDDAQMTGLAEPDFVRTGPTKAGHYLFWESGCIFATPDADGTKEIAGSDEFPVIATSIATWNTDVDTSSCSYISIVENAPQSLEVGNDGVNLIKFRDASWCRPAVDDDPARCYADSAAGITTATYVDDGANTRDGAIVDADIEINGVDFAISVNGVTLGTASCDAELQNTLTHELGHLHGLEHTCLAPGDPPRIDNNGSAVPECADTTDPLILDATMYNYQDCGETKKETLSDDDINAICTIYPLDTNPNTCTTPAPISSGCCDAGRGAPAGSLVLGIAVLGLLRRKTRRRL
ncbi:MAG TPA: hypothetical protein VGG74_09725 [Kofleriaceae bacterium]|jgi:hypothetical protein